MASPFRLFRKHKATLLVVAGVLLMFVFVVGDPLMSYIGSTGRDNVGGGHDPHDVAVRWDGGKLTNAELSQLVMRRRIVNAVLRQVVYEGALAASDGGRNMLPPLRVQPLELPERADQNVEQDIVRMVIVADAARSVGMRISDEQIVHYLQQLGRGYVSTNHLREIISSLRVGGGVSVDYALDALREELLARNYLVSYVFALDTMLPEQRWEDWLSLNDRVIVEAAAIPIELFLVDVPEPTEPELAAFFVSKAEIDGRPLNEREPQPELVGGIEMPSPHPGFAVPRKVELQLLRADYEMFLEKAAAEVTDEEVQTFYEENKDPYFIRAATDMLDAVLDDPAATDSAEAADSAAEDGAGQNDTEAEEANADDAHADDADGYEVDSGNDPEFNAVPSDADQSSIQESRRRSVFRLAAFAEEGEGGDDPTPTAEAGPTDDSAEGESATEPAANGETIVEAEVEDEIDDGAVEPSNDAAADVTEKPKQFQPLEEVRNEIRRTIAQLKVSEQLAKLMGKLEGELSASYAAYRGAVLDADEAGKELPPPPPELADLSALAEEHGLEYQKTAPISALELGGLPIGQSHRADEENVPPEQRVPFRYLAFDKDWEHYQSMTTFDTDNNRYLVMKIADIPGFVPQLEDIRDDVVRAWRRQQAAELALKHAQAEARKAKSAESLEEFFADDQHVTVTKTDLFSRYTVGTDSRRTGDVQSFRLSKPDGIEGADFDVMDTIFDLGPGDVGAVLNHDHSIAYLLRIGEHELTPAELQQAFLSEADTWYGLSAWRLAHSRDAMGALLAEMRESAGVKWERPADQPYREGE